MANLLILNRYSEQGASSRLRTLQYIPMLEAAGFHVTTLPLFDHRYLNTIYKVDSWLGGRLKSLGIVLSAMFKRLKVVLAKNEFDVIWVEKELYPFLPGPLEGLLARSGVPYIVDYDDAIFHRYDQSRYAPIRWLLGTKLDHLLRHSFAVSAGNEYLANYARSHGAKCVIQVPTVVDLDRYDVLPEPEVEEIRIGWIGSPSTAPYLSLISEPLRSLAAERAIRLVTVGAPKFTLSGVPLEQHDWSLETEAKLVSTFHIGVMPLANTLWEQGKCGYKLIQYMACGRPVIASSVGVNPEIVSGDAGCLASNDDEWLEALRKLSISPKIRQSMGNAARASVEQKYCLQVTSGQIIEKLREAVAASRLVVRS